MRYLWRYRERPASLHRWLVVWAKRARQFPALVALLGRCSKFRRRGASIGRHSVIGIVRIEGALRDLVIGDEVALGRCEMRIHAPVSIGRRAVISDGAVLLTGTHDLRRPDWPLRVAPISVGEYAWIAQNAIVLPGVSIGRGAVVAAGAVVRHDVPDYALAVGNPARIESGKRSESLDYSPVRGVAAFEAWLGPHPRRLGSVTPHLGTAVGSRDA